jgi:hypothetical protein
MIEEHGELGGMHRSSRIASCVHRLTIDPESIVFRGAPENPIISEAGHFGGTADGILLRKIFLMKRFQ